MEDRLQRLEAARWAVNVSTKGARKTRCGSFAIVARRGIEEQEAARKRHDDGVKRGGRPRNSENSVQDSPPSFTTTREAEKISGKTRGRLAKEAVVALMPAAAVSVLGVVSQLCGH
jgi:hypothetical protein